MLDVAIWDTITPQNLPGGGWDETKPIGGSEKNVMLLVRALRAAGVTVGFVQNAESDMCRTLIVHRYSQMPIWLEGMAWTCRVVWAQDKERYTDRRHLPHVFVSRWQRSWHGLDGPVIYPFLDLPPVDDLCLPGRFIYPCARIKGLQATLDAWSTSPHRLDRLVVCNTYDDDRDGRIEQACREHGARWIGRKTAGELVQEIRRSEGLFMINTYPECFPMTVHIAHVLGKKLYVRCQGHSECGIEEARRDQDLSDATLTKAWLEALHL